MPDCPELRRAIAAIRARRPLSQAEAAALLGYTTHQGVGHVERIALRRLSAAMHEQGWTFDDLAP